MKGIIMQLACAAIVCMGNFLSGYNITWSSYSLVALESDTSPIGYKISKGDGSLVGSTPMLGCFIPVFFSGWLCDTIGRKRTDIISALFLVLGWSIISTAPNVTQILIGRFIGGIGTGIHLIVCMPLVGEICTPKLLGTLTSLCVQSYAFGTLVSYVTGWLFSYQVVNYINLTLSVLFVVLLNLIKETPAFLLLKGQEKEALNSLKFYRGESKTTQDILDELAYIRNQGSSNDNVPDLDKDTTKLNEKEILGLDQNTSRDNDLNPWKILWTSKPVQRATVTATFYFLLLVFGGTIAVQAYAGALFTRAAPGISAHICSIILSVAFSVGAVLSTIVSGLVGRRTLMISSASTSAIFLAVLASLLKWSWGPVWMVPAAVLGYCCSFQLGVACVPLVQVSESFQPKMKGLVCAITIGFMCVGNFIVLASFSPAIEHFGIDGTFLMFSLICAATALIAFFTMKETKGKTVEEIEEMYAKGYFTTTL